MISVVKNPFETSLFCLMQIINQKWTRHHTGLIMDSSDSLTTPRLPSSIPKTHWTDLLSHQLSTNRLSEMFSRTLARPKLEFSSSAEPLLIASPTQLPPLSLAQCQLKWTYPNTLPFEKAFLFFRAELCFPFCLPWCTWTLWRDLEAWPTMAWSGRLNSTDSRSSINNDRGSFAIVRLKRTQN